MKLKKGDNVLVISGKDKGKRGSITQVFPRVGKLTVIGVNIAKHHLKPSRKNPQGGIIDKLAPFEASNVIIICPRCSQPTRVGYRITDNKSAKGGSASGRKIRICKKCHESLD